MTDKQPAFVTRVIEDGGLDCANCGQWRGLYGDQYIETCPHCKDEEFDIYLIVEKAEQLP
jgi:hypothetical protein